MGCFSLTRSTPITGQQATLIKEVPLNIKDSKNSLEVHGGEFQLTFNKVYGTIDSWTYQGVKLLETGPRLHFWRAPIDNDMLAGNQWQDLSSHAKWKKYGLHWLQQRIDSVEYNISSDQHKVEIL